MLNNTFYKKNKSPENGVLTIPKKIRVPRFEHGTKFGLDLEDLEDFFRAIRYSEDANAQRDFLMFKIIVFHGLRRQEAANLKITDLIWKRKGRTLEKDRIHIKAVKNGREGNELMNPVEKDLILEYLKVRKEDGSGLLFTSQKAGSPGISTFAISDAYKKYAILAKLPPEKCHVHCLRHTYAYLMIESGATAEQIMFGLRQKDIKSAMEYVRESKKVTDMVQERYFNYLK